MLIGLSGYAQSGKDTVAGFFNELFGMQRVAFADLMREFALAVDPIVDWNPAIDHPVRLSGVVDALGWDVAKTTVPEVRAILQRLGTDAGRKLFGDSFWIDQTFARVNDDVVVADVRFPDEGHAVKSRGGIVIRIERPGVEAVNDHVSEHAMDRYEFDHYLYNNSTLEELRRAIRLYGVLLGLKECGNAVG